MTYIAKNKGYVYYISTWIFWIYLFKILYMMRCVDVIIIFYAISHWKDKYLKGNRRNTRNIGLGVFFFFYKFVMMTTTNVFYFRNTAAMQLYLLYFTGTCCIDILFPTGVNMFVRRIKKNNVKSSLNGLLLWCHHV